MEPTEFRRHGHAVIDWIADYLEAPEKWPVLPDVRPGDLRKALPASPPRVDWRSIALPRPQPSLPQAATAKYIDSLGPTALQAGSYNRPGYLRFDFSWSSALSDTTRLQIEDEANQAVRHDLPVLAQTMSLEAARDLGAAALFGGG